MAAEWAGFRQAVVQLGKPSRNGLKANVPLDVSLICHRMSIAVQNLPAFGAFPSSSVDVGAMRPAMVMVLAVAVLALPGAVLAFSTRFELPVQDFAANQGSGFANDKGSALARAIESKGWQAAGALFRFTPAGLAARPDRSVTVAVRVDEETARAIVVRAPAVPAAQRMSATLAGLRLAPAAYNLGMARGYQTFSGSPGQTYSLPGSDTRRQEMPDLSALVRGTDAPSAESRLAARISLGERERAGRAPRTLESLGEQSVDLGGSYRVLRNLDVTAGVRYSQDRDRLKPINDGKTDGQAVFVGTQFRF